METQWKHRTVLGYDSTLDYQVNQNVAAFFERAAAFDTVALDVETDMDKDNELVLFQLGLPDGTQHLYTADYIDQFGDFLEQKELIAHNAAFEISILARHNIYPKRWIDTMLVEQIILCGDPYFKGASLAKTLKRYFDIDMDKSLQTRFKAGMLTGSHYEYAAMDVAYMHDLVSVQSIQDTYNAEVVKLEHDYLLVVTEMSRTGMRVDVEGWQQVIALVDAEYTEALAKLNTYAEINWRSPQQRLKVLQDHGVNAGSTAKTVLVDYMQHQIVVDLIAFSESSSKKSKLGITFLEHVQDDGTIHTHYRQIIATGRSSSSAVNLQNVPKEFRKYFSPTIQGNVYVSADYSQQELVILGFASGEPAWVEAAKRGDDLHAMCAAEIYPQFNTATEEQQKEMRSKVKAINFSLSYGTGMHSLAKRIEMSYTETSKLVVRYFRKFKYLEKYLTKLSQSTKLDQEAFTLPPFNRRRLISAQESWGSMGRKGKNTPPQGSAADMMKLAANLLYKRGLPIKFVHVVHDALYLETTPEFAPEALKQLTECMEKAGDVIVPSGLIHVDGEISTHW